jgi:hypothetical protein
LLGCALFDTSFFFKTIGAAPFLHNYNFLINEVFGTSPNDLYAAKPGLPGREYLSQQPLPHLYTHSEGFTPYQTSPQATMIQSSRFNALAAHLTPSGLRTSFRRSSSLSSAGSSSSSRPTSLRSSQDVSGSPVMTINSIVLRQPSYLELEAERRSYASELSILEPRPVVYWGSLEERMGSF